MASDYPGAIDSFDAIPATLAGPPTHELLHEEVHNAIVAVQTELGVNPAGSASTVVARLDAAGAGNTAVTSSSTDSSSITSETTVLTAASYTFVAGRRYEVRIDMEVAGPADEIYMLRLKDGATVLRRREFGNDGWFSGTSTGYAFGVELEYVNTTSLSGAKTLTATLERVVGTSSVQMRTAGAAAYLRITDIGAL